MSKTNKAILLGCLAGLIDVIPMILQGLSWDANLSAFTMWIVIGFFLSVIKLKINCIVKGLLISYLTLLPTAILIVGAQPVALIPVFL